MLKKSLTILVLLLSLAMGAQAAEVKQDKVKVGDLTVNYFVQGSGYPVILIHGGGMTSSMWEALAQELENNYTVYRPDNRGHGLTNNPSGEFSYPAMANDVVGFAKALKIDKPLIMGYSDGGLISIMVGVYHPDFAKAIIVGGAALSLGDEHYQKGMLTGFGSEKAGKKSMSELDEILKTQPWIEGFMSKLHHPEIPDYWKGFLANIWGMWTTPFTIDDADMQKFKTPTLVLTGDRDEYFTARSAVELYEKLENGELAIIPNGVHSLVKLRTDLFYAIIKDFFARQFTASPEKSAAAAVAG